MFKFDHTQRSVVVMCVQCHARSIRPNRAAAERWALEHLDVAHPGPSPEQERFLHSRSARLSIQATRRDLR